MDGLILEETPYRAVFLPQVWATLPDPSEFLAQLKLKAGLSAGHWSDRIRFWRFRVREIGESTPSGHVRGESA
jgi:AMMECR1 domain-containing protein